MPWSQTLEHTGAKSWELLAQQGTRPPELPSQGQTCLHPGQGQTLLIDLSQISPPCTESTMTLKGVLPMDPLLGQTGQRPCLLNSDAGCHTEKQKGSWKPQKRTHFPSSQASFSGQDPLPVFKKTYTMGRILVRIRLGDDSVKITTQISVAYNHKGFLLYGSYRLPRQLLSVQWLRKATPYQQGQGRMGTRVSLSSDTLHPRMDVPANLSVYPLRLSAPSGCQTKE